MSLLFVALGAVPAQACTVDWNGSASSSWSDPANWTPNGTPGPADTVCMTDGATETVVDGAFSVLDVTSPGRPLRVTAGTLTITGAQTASLGAVTINSGGVLGGTAPVDMASLTWPDGRIEGSGLKRVSGVAEVKGAIFSADHARLGHGARFRTDGTTTVQNTEFFARRDSLWTNTGTLINNYRMFEDQTDPTPGGAAPRLVNTATGIIKSDFQSRIGLDLANEGVVQGDHTSTIEMFGGGSGGGTFGGWLSGGTWTFADGAKIDGAYLGSGPSAFIVARGRTVTAKNTTLRGPFSGAGTLVLDNGVDTFDSPVIGGPGFRLLVPVGKTFNATDYVQIADGTRIESDGTVNFNPCANCQANLVFLGRGRWENRGTITLGRVFINDAVDTPGDFPIINTGLIEKVDAQQSQNDNMPLVRATVVNAGTVRVDRGQLRVDRDWRQTPSGRLLFDIRGPAIGTDYGALMVQAGDFGAAGDLEIMRSTSFQPDDEAVFYPVQAGLGTGRVSGAFERILGTDLGGGASFAVTKNNAFGVDLTVDRPGPRADPPAASVPDDLVPAPLTVTGERWHVLPGTTFTADLLRNDRVPAGSRIVLLSTSRGVRARVLASGSVRVRVTRRARRTAALRYRVVAPDGRASVAVRVRLRVVRA